MSSHHPTSALLKQFSEATLDGSVATVVAAHVEYCSSCKGQVKGLEEVLAAGALSLVAPLSSGETDDAWKQISSRMKAPLGPTSPQSRSGSIIIDGKVFELPRSLQKLTSRPLRWMPFGKRSPGSPSAKLAKLGEEGGKSLFLIYLASNEAVPLHSHEGAEHSYVVSGSYSADGLTFETGDFSASNPDVIHAPMAGSEDGCLLLSSVENRLNFFQGWLRPFNGLLWWVLSLRVKFMN